MAEAPGVVKELRVAVFDVAGVFKTGDMSGIPASPLFPAILEDAVDATTTSSGLGLLGGVFGIALLSTLLFPNAKLPGLVLTGAGAGAGAGITVAGVAAKPVGTLVRGCVVGAPNPSVG